MASTVPQPFNAMYLFRCDNADSQDASWVERPPDTHTTWPIPRTGVCGDGIVIALLPPIDARLGRYLGGGTRCARASDFAPSICRIDLAISVPTVPHSGRRATGIADRQSGLESFNTLQWKRKQEKKMRNEPI